MWWFVPLSLSLCRCSLSLPPSKRIKRIIQSQIVNFNISGKSRLLSRLLDIIRSYDHDKRSEQAERVSQVPFLSVFISVLPYYIGSL